MHKRKDQEKIMKIIESIYKSKYPFLYPCNLKFVPFSQTNKLIYIHQFDCALRKHKSKCIT